MKFVKYTGITWSDVELAGLLEDEDSYVSFERFKKHLGLHPFHLTNLSNALNEILCSKLNSYDTDLKGFIVAYKNPKLLTPLGEIVYDSCFIHIDVEADFYVFRPQVGISLKGIVKKIVPEHIGVVVHKAFTVIVLRPTDDENWVGNNVQMLQEVRVTLTVLNLASKVLSYIGGIFDPDDYLRGCRLPETHVNTNCISFDDDVEDDTQTRSRKSFKQSKQSKHMFFESDFENASEDVSPTKKKRDKYKKLNKSLEQKEVKYAEKEKKDKRRSKKAKEVKKSESPEYTSNSYMNGNFTGNEELEEFVTPKSKLKKKSKRRSSQSSINADTNEECEKHLSKEISKRLSDTESDDRLNKIKLKQKRTSNGLDWNVEENIPENKVKVKKNSRKRKCVDSSDQSVDEFSSYKYVPHSSKRNSKSLNDSEETSDDIKMSKFNDTNQGKNKIKASSKKKRNMDLETSESDVNTKNVSLKGKSKNCKIQNTKIKTERATSGSENTQDEDYIKTIKVPRMDSELDMFTHSFSCDLVDDDEGNTRKKEKKHSKNKIKVEPEFEEIVTKVERPYNEDEDIYEEDEWNLSKINSPKKKHKAYLANSIESDETNTKSNTKYFNKTKIADKGTKSHNIKVEVDSCVISTESDNDDQHTYSQNSKAKLKHEKVSSDSDFDVHVVRIKTEKFLDDY